MRAHDDPSTRPARLKRRAEFLRVGKGRRWHGKAMTLQTEARSTGRGDVEQEVDGSGSARFGFTLTKKVGNAVIRNRARRRLREAVRLAPDLPTRASHDYVVVGRIEAIRLPFVALIGELTRGVAAVHERGKRREGVRPAHVSSGMSAASAARPKRAEPSNARSPAHSAPDKTRPEP